jgi:multiple sugar transport system permease protein
VANAVLPSPVIVGPAAGSTVSRPRSKAALKSVAHHAILVVVAAAFVLPLYWMVTTSVKSNSQLYSIPPTWVPRPVEWHFYPDAVNYIPFFTFLKNSVEVTALTVVGTLVSCSLVAYGFARIRWRGRNVVFVLVLATLMLPYPVVMIPQFLIFSDLRWINTLQPLWVPAFFAASTGSLSSAFYIFLLRQFFMTIPQELSDAARVDGANELTIFFRVVLPMAKPALATVAIFSFIGAWNDFLGPLIYLDSEKNFTLTLGMQYFIQLHTADWQMLMAIATLMALPVIILFFLAQRVFIRGIALNTITL